MNKQNESKINNKFIELQIGRKEVLEESYYLFFGSSIISGIVVGLLKPQTSIEQRISEILISTLIMSIVFTVISLSIRRMSNIKRFDWVVFVLAILFYLVTFLMSPVQKVLASIIVYPSLVMLVFSTMSRLKVSLFFGLHFILVLFYFIKDPKLEVVITAHNYVTLLTISIVMYVMMMKITKLFNEYQSNISDDFTSLNEKNIELQALNEEYLATQEELFEKYDEVSKLNELNERLAFFDELTGVNNRNGFIRFVEKLIQKGDQNNYMIFLDIVRFKDINSVYGYNIGDAIIRQMVGRIEALPFEVKEKARLGGDLFAMVISNKIEWEVLLLALNRLNDEMQIEDFAIGIRTNMGILEALDLDLSAGMILQQVDVALNKAKESSDQYFYIYGNKLSNEITRRVRMTQALEKAIDNKEITIVMQPIVDVKTKNIISFESLARWQSEEFGNVSPGEFIGLAEKTKLIRGITWLMLHYVCGFISQYHLENIVTVSVNISGYELRKKDLADWLTEIVDQFEIPHTAIAFEVTETGLIEQFETAAGHLELLRQRGFKIYLDDFGVGYSSLNYLEKLPIDVLKIDRSFIKDIDSNEKKQQMVQMMLHLSEDLHLTTVAEGVETEKEYKLLESYGIHRIQGYYFYKPMTTLDLVPHIKDRLS